MAYLRHLNSTATLLYNITVYNSNITLLYNITVEYNIEHKPEYHDLQNREIKLKHLRGCISFLDDTETIANVQNSQLETVEFS